MLRTSIFRTIHLCFSFARLLLSLVLSYLEYLSPSLTFGIRRVTILEELPPIPGRRPHSTSVVGMDAVRQRALDDTLHMEVRSTKALARRCAALEWHVEATEQKTEARLIFFF